MLRRMDERATTDLKSRLQRREAGSVHFHLGERGQETDTNMTGVTGMLDEYISARGFRKIGKEWIEVDRDTACLALESILAKDLAYKLEAMPASEAEAIANQFVRLFSKGSRFFTNGTWHSGWQETSPITAVGPSWMAISDATFDGGVVAFDDKSIGMIWVEDED